LKLLNSFEQGSLIEDIPLVALVQERVNRFEHDQGVAQDTGYMDSRAYVGWRLSLNRFGVACAFPVIPRIPLTKSFHVEFIQRFTNVRELQIKDRLPEWFAVVLGCGAQGCTDDDFDGFIIYNITGHGVVFFLCGLLNRSWLSGYKDTLFNAPSDAVNFIGIL
jgi:hypothetical protein